jgi:four helix bundle protein
MVEEVYKLTDQIPKHEMYGLTSQTIRSAVSTPLNIAEGTARNSRKEFLQC